MKYRIKNNSIVSKIYDAYRIVMKAYRYVPNDTAEELLTWL